MTDNTSHHYVPRAAGMTCIYCGLTQKQIAAQYEK